MKIKKILNNNAVVVLDHDEEKIAMGSGIAFEKKKNDIVNPNKIEKIFVMKENEKFQQLLQQIPEEYVTLSEEIISYAEQYLDTKLNEHIHIALTDHLSFAIERTIDGLHLKNKLLNEIKILYKKEFEIGMWAIQFIEKETSVKMPVDEAAYIALHIHTSNVSSGNMDQIVQQATIISDMVQTIKNCLGIDIEEDDISYQRLITHLRFAISRYNEQGICTMDEEMLTMLKTKFRHSFQCAEHVAHTTSSQYNIKLPDSELGYICIHIERLRQR
ncbi:PRD domain-containing protein [Bacillaceae bacterium S4-13-56]